MSFVEYSLPNQIVTRTQDSTVTVDLILEMCSVIKARGQTVYCSSPNYSGVRKIT